MIKSEHILTVILICICTLPILAQKMDAYTIYNSKGRKVSFRKMAKAAAKSDVVFFGEYHNNPICHWLELQVAKELHETGRNLILGAEMIESDNQGALDAYLGGTLDSDGLDSLARLWSNYQTDYAPLVDFAKANNLKFIGTNIPRRYASKVYREGGFEALQSLPDEDLAWIAPYPIPFDPTLSQYQTMSDMVEGHGGTAFAQAQAIKDATMAHFILSNFEADDLFLHYNGTYHSDYYQGILWYLHNEDPTLKSITISTVEQSDIYRLDDEHRGKADFILCIDAEMTKTY